MKTINELDPQKERIYGSNLSWFMEYFDDTGLSNKKKGPDYLVMDNFASFFGFETADLLGARSEAETMSNAGCKADLIGK